jgi:leucyl-tRNA synthetase
MEMDFKKIEQDWKQRWEETGLYTVQEDTTRPKFYVLDMFPYPSGAGLHVGHPLGYVASDIFARYKRLKGFNVLHPMGFDAFGLPAEQYAIETGTHPAITTRKNIDYYEEQLRKIGFSYDWNRKVETSDPAYYKWTQWIFMQLFNSWYDADANKARSIDSLTELLRKEGSKALLEKRKCDRSLTAAEWAAMSELEQQRFLMQFRLAYLDYAEVWWCEALGTVLANDEVKDGVSERGGHPAERIRMRQWFLRITEYADRLLNGLESLDWSDAMKDMQRNWIGRSEGAIVRFDIAGTDKHIEIFTTRPDTIFGATFMVLAPEHELVPAITAAGEQAAVQEYLTYVKTRSERDRQAEVKKVTGQFTGAYAVHPFTEQPIPIYIAEYVLAGYGTGAIMAVPSNDERDRAFAEKFDIPIIPVVDQQAYPNVGIEEKVGVMQNSGFLNGMEVKAAIQRILQEIEQRGLGYRKINYRLRDAGYSRQRYWGEPFPVVFKEDMPYLLDVSELPLVLPDVPAYKPGGQAKSPLAALSNWVQLPDGSVRETDTMPGYAGSSWYFLRYMDPHNNERFVGEEAEKYWGSVDLYVGGTEHAVGHLLYSRMWQKFLFDRGWVSQDEPFKKLVNQGMIQGVSAVAYRLHGGMRIAEHIEPRDIFISKLLKIKIENGEFSNEELANLLNPLLHREENSSIHFHDDSFNFGFTEIHLTSKFLINDCFDIDLFSKSNEPCSDGIFVKDEDGQFRCELVPEKMSKRYRNVTNPDDVIAKYGADCFRMYEMFLGPIEASKPWDTKGITGVSGFLRKFWRLYVAEDGSWKVTAAAAEPEAVKVLHKCILKVGEDIERLSFNTAVSAFMIATNQLTELKCTSKEVLEPMLILLAPFAPFITEELWERLGHTNSVHMAAWPEGDASLLVESSFSYPVSINGKVRTNELFPLDMPKEEMEKAVMALDSVLKWTEGKQPKKIIIVPGRIINIVV